MVEKASKEVLSLLEQGWRYLDVRTQAEFDIGHTPSAINIPVQHGGLAGLYPNESFVTQVRERVPLAARLVVGCKAGGRARAALKQLSEAGYKNLVLHRDGFDGERDAFGTRSGGWLHLGLPVAAGPDSYGSR